MTLRISALELLTADRILLMAPKVPKNSGPRQAVSDFLSDQKSLQDMGLALGLGLGLPAQ